MNPEETGANPADCPEDVSYNSYYRRLSLGGTGCDSPCVRLMPYKDQDKNRTWHRNRYRKKVGCLTRSVNYKFLPEEERHERTSTVKKTCAENRKLHVRKTIDTLLGSDCFLCHDTKNLVSHRKDGTRHSTNESSIKCVKREPEKFVRLCKQCHNGVHWMMRKFNMSWEEIYSIASGVVVKIVITRSLQLRG